MRRTDSGATLACPQPFQAWLEAEVVAGPQRSYRLARKLPQQLRPFGRAAAASADWALAHTLFWMGRFEESRSMLAAIRLDSITPESQSVGRKSAVPSARRWDASKAEGHTAEGAALFRPTGFSTLVGADEQSRFNLPLLIPAQLAWVLALLGETENAIEHSQRALRWAQSQPDSLHLASAHDFLAHLHCFLDAPEATLAYSRLLRDTDTGPNGMATLLEYWALSRLGLPTDESAAQTALAELRRHSPAQEARAFSLYAQALFHQAPAHAQGVARGFAQGFALTQLDAALDLNARFGLHHWEARLLHLKSQSLDAAGQLTEASRFHRLAIGVAQRQGARLFLNRIAGIESCTQAGPHMEYAA